MPGRTRWSSGSSEAVSVVSASDASPAMASSARPGAMSPANARRTLERRKNGTTHRPGHAFMADHRRPRGSVARKARLLTEEVERHVHLAPARPSPALDFFLEAVADD